MNKDSYVSVEDWLASQKYNRPRFSQSYDYNKLVRDRIANVLMERFDWDYWVTITFGYKPLLEEVEDVLYKTNYRIDRRIVKKTDKSVMSSQERSDWIMFPELSGRGLHYHGFIKLNVRPNLQSSYEDEWQWMRTAFKDTLDKMNPLISTLKKGEKIDFRIYPRSSDNLENLKMVLYTLKEQVRGEQKDTFDRVSNIIVSRDDWKPSPISKRRSVNKLDVIPARPNQLSPFDLL